MYANLSDKDFRLGLNAARTTLASVAKLAGAKTAPGIHLLRSSAARRVLASSMSGLPGSALAISLRYRP
jgi:hypothetical protein